MRTLARAPDHHTFTTATSPAAAAWPLPPPARHTAGRGASTTGGQRLLDYREYVHLQVEVRGQPGAWPEELDLQQAPPWVRQLAAHQLCLEQEAIVLDARLPPALDSMLM